MPNQEGQNPEFLKKKYKDLSSSDAVSEAEWRIGEETPKTKPLERIQNYLDSFKQIAEEENPALKLRVYITGGGCSGFQYGFTFDESVNEGDTTIENSGVTLVVDPMSLQYLIGGVVDYTEGLEGARFFVNNPNATTTCGCGASFSV